MYRIRGKHKVDLLIILIQLLNISHETNKERGKQHEIWMWWFLVGMKIRLTDNMYQGKTPTIPVLAYRCDFHHSILMIFYPNMS